MKRDYKNETRIYCANLSLGDFISFGGKKDYMEVTYKDNKIIIAGSNKYLLDNYCFKYLNS